MEEPTDAYRDALKPVLAAFAKGVGQARNVTPDAEIAQFKLDTMAGLLARQVGDKFALSDAATQRALDTLAKKSQNPEALQMKYKDLKSRNVAGLNNFVCILEKIAQDHSLSAAISRHAPRPAPREALRQGDINIRHDMGAFAKPSGAGPRHDRLGAESVATSVDISAISAASERPAEGARLSMRDNLLFQASPRPTSPTGQDGFGDGPMDAHAGSRAGNGGAAGTGAVGELLAAVGDLLEPLRASSVSLTGDHPMPRWLVDRDFLSGDHVLRHLEEGAADAETSCAPLSTFPPAVQEQLVIDDLLFAALGFPGRYVRLARNDDTGSPCFSLAPGLEPSLEELALRLLPVCRSALLVRRFVQTRSMSPRGLVCQALAAVMGQYLSDWGVLVAQLEHQWRMGRLTLQSMLYYCQPALSALDLLASVVTEVAERSLAGADVLNLLSDTEARTAGTPFARGVLRELLAATCEPYLRILHRWVAEGALDDPYQEFLVEESASYVPKPNSTMSDWWTSRFKLRPKVPSFLEPLADLVLRTGKYLNALKELRADGEPPLPAGTRLRYSPDPRPLRDALVAAHETASARLMRVVREDGNLVARLQSLRKFYLTAQGDFLMHFVDLADAELSKSIMVCKKESVEALFDVAVRTTGASTDPFAEDFGVAWDYYSITRTLKVLFLGQEDTDKVDKNKRAIDCLVLSCKVDGPAALVISHRALLCYRLLFRHVLYIKNIERKLCAAIMGIKACRATRDPALASVVSSLQGLLQHMTQVLQQYQSYMFLEVLDPGFEDMIEKIGAAKNVDEAIAAHLRFLETSVVTLLMYQTDSPGSMLFQIYSVLGTCGEFAMLVSSIIQRDALPDEIVAKLMQPELPRAIAARRKDFATKCSQLIGFLLTHVSNDQALLSLAGRLDYNGFLRQAGASGVDALTRAVGGMAV